MGGLRLLCMGDNHGDANSIEQVIEQTEGQEFDFVIHVGDITNACIDGMDEGAKQLRELLPLFEGLTDRGELVFVWGNRDYEVCMKGFGERIDQYADFDFDVGTHIPSDGNIEVDGQAFTQDPSAVNGDTLLVTHYYHADLLDHFPGRAYISGHIHNGRFKNRILNTAFLHRGDEHGGKPLQGGYFTVELDDSAMQVEMHSLGGISRSTCPNHGVRGDQFHPAHWRTGCSFCYDQDDFYEEILGSVRRDLELEGLDPTEENLVQRGLELYGDKQVPKDFRSKLTEFSQDYV